MIKSIQYLRGLAALMVVFFHFRHELNGLYAGWSLGDVLFDQGAFGVDLFFIISGFIICYSTRRPEPRPVATYTLKRVFRIYPLLIVSVLAFYFLVGSHGYSLGRSLIPLHADYSDEGPFFGYNMLAPAWTLTYEISFYGLFLLGLAASHRHRRFLTASLILATFVILQWWFNGRVELSAYENLGYGGSGIVRSMLAILSSPMILEFVYGIGLYALYVQLPDVPDRFRRPASILLLALAALAVAGYYASPLHGHGPTHWGLPSLLLVASLLMYERINGLPDVRVLFFFGKISYSLYLTHVLVMSVIRAHRLDFGLTGVWAFLYAVVLSIAVASFVYTLVEHQAIIACRKLLKRWATGASSQAAPQAS